MKVSCPACDSKYTIADEKVSGRKVKVRCKSCGGQILINGTIPPPAPAADESQTAQKSSPKASSPEQDAPTKSSPENRSAEAEVAPPSGGRIWSVNVSETDERSLETHQIVEGYLSGEFANEVYVWHDGMVDWALIDDVPELVQAINAARSAQPAAPTVEAPASVRKPLPTAAKASKEAVKGEGKDVARTTAAPKSEPIAKKTAARAAGTKRPQSAHDLFAAASAAGAELDVSVPEDDASVQKRTGARNENSVLFSLDALKAGITATPAAEPVRAAPGRKAPAAPRKKLEDLMMANDGVGPLATPAATTLLNANQALLTAPAPPPPPPPKPEPVPVVVPEGAAAIAAAVALETQKARKKGMLTGLIAAIVAVGAVGIAALVMSKGKPEPAAVASAKPVVPSAALAVAPTTPPKPAESALAEAKPAESSSAPSTSPTSATGTAPSKPTAVAQVGSKAAPKSETKPEPKADAKPEAKKEPKKEEASVPVSTGVASFNKESAAQALAVAASQTSICKKADGPTGQGKVQVTFAPSGRATTANIVSGPFGGTAVGGCVSGVFKRARVPAFAGDPVTVSKSFTISP